MFNGSFLWLCSLLQFKKKLDFAFLSLGGPSHGARADQAMVPGIGVSAEFQSIGTSGKK